MSSSQNRHPSTGSTEDLSLAFHGAAGTVTGSKHLLTAAGARILLDAGVFQGLKELRLRNWEAPGFNPKTIDHVVLSHTHIDHVGFLPRLVKLGLDAPVHCTPAAFDLAKLMLLDSARLQEEDARRANRKGYTKHEPALPLYTSSDAWDALDLRRRQSYGNWFDLHPEGKVRARFHNAGHILGSAFIELRIDHGGHELTLVYSADIGRFDAPLHPDPAPPPACDVLILESTYGDRLHTTVPIEEQLVEPLRRVFARGGTVLVPAFAVGRAQIVALVLRRMMSEGLLPEVPIHVDSPMAVSATEIYNRFLDPHNVDADLFEDGRRRLFSHEVFFHETVADSMRLNSQPGPRVIISASGMLTGGRVLHHLRRLAPETRNMILLAGFQAAGTRGRQLAEGAKKIKAFGGEIAVHCEVMLVHGFSGHADQGELLRWVESAPKPPEVVFLVHGEEPGRQALGKLLGERLGLRTIAPEHEQAFDLARELGLERRPGVAPSPRAEPAPKPATPSPPVERRQPLPVERPKPASEDPEAPAHLVHLLESPSYRRIDEDPDFLKREELRPARLQLEYLKPDLLMRDWGVEATIVVFGGTRILEPGAAHARLEQARMALAAKPGDAALERAVVVAERVMAKSHYYDEARLFGRLVAQAGRGPQDRRLLVVTGGGPGIMEAANRGAFDTGAPSLGLNITLPHEQFPNPYITPELCFQFRYFALRKMHFLLRARALVTFPGGYGTLDELFETLCLIQTRKIDPLPIVLVGKEFWRGVFDAEYLVNEGMIDPEDVELFWYAETAQETWDGILAWYQKRGEPLIKHVDHAVEEERR